ncbi:MULTISPECIES: ABC transporter permease [unclassified Xanthobacter]|uniref:ABC transporter permease n=1 Tax=unclassified Xanthobacter TaxID=2623496 RepID=UPI001EE093E0|nr:MULTISPECIES: ABC transporter permease [unclassified Xanthobacter]
MPGTEATAPTTSSGAAPRSIMDRLRGPRSLRFAHAAAGYAFLVVLVLIWHLAASSGLYPSHLLPTPGAVMAALQDAFLDGNLVWNVSQSLERQLVGYIASVVIGLPLGLWLGWSRWAQSALQTTIRLIYPIPGVAWVPLAILWFGLGFKSIIFAIFITAVFPIIVNTAAGVSAIDEQYLRVIKVFGTKPARAFRRVVVPAAMPFILTGLRLGYGTGWRVIISAEILAATDGLGFMIDNARWQLRPDLVIGGMVIIGVVGLLVETVFFDWLERRTIGRWGMRRAD